jgi:hypothetical protein
MVVLVQDHERAFRTRIRIDQVQCQSMHPALLPSTEQPIFKHSQALIIRGYDSNIDLILVGEDWREDTHVDPLFSNL